jgi:hypothetical protein
MLRFGVPFPLWPGAGKVHIMVDDSLTGAESLHVGAVLRLTERMPAEFDRL